jgi:hypothetical protein
MEAIITRKPKCPLVEYVSFHHLTVSFLQHMWLYLKQGYHCSDAKGVRKKGSSMNFPDSKGFCGFS